MNFLEFLYMITVHIDVYYISQQPYFYSFNIAPQGWGIILECHCMSMSTVAEWVEICEILKKEAYNNAMMKRQTSNVAKAIPAR